MEKILPSTNRLSNPEQYVTHIVGIGCYNTSIEQLAEFINNCPSNNGLAFIIVSYSFSKKNLITIDMLSSKLTIPVLEVNNGMKISPNCVHLISGQNKVIISNKHLFLVKQTTDGKTNFPIDLFFNSLAVEEKNKSIGILLTESGMDGFRGAKAIKEIGGTIFLSHTDVSKVNSTPKNLELNKIADYILPPIDLALELSGYIKRPQYVFPATPTGFQNSEKWLKKILEIIKNDLGHDFLSYKKSTLLRRTAKRISITKSKSVKDYIEFLRENEKEKVLLTQEFLIRVTKFFRDREAFEIIENKIIPNIISRKEKAAGESIKIWVVACSTGEEAYSLTILLEKFLNENNLSLNYKVFATDIDEQALEIATKGIYSKHIESEIPSEILDKFFIKKENKYHIHSMIRKNIIFSKHDVVQNPPFNKIDLISCRNMLIYMESNLQQKAISNMHYGLRNNAYLFLGKAENLGNEHHHFNEISRKWKIFQNNNTPASIINEKNNKWNIDTNKEQKTNSKNSVISLEDKIAKASLQTLTQELMAVSICVDENLEIIHATGMFKKYIEYPEEGYSNNLLKMLPEELKIHVGVAIRQLFTNPKKVILRDVLWAKDDVLIQIRLIIKSLDINALSGRCFLVTIIEKSSTTNNTNILKTISSNETITTNKIEKLEDDLKKAKQSLKSTIKELDISNEEILTTNDELLTSNEELQCTNEELQSLNEELYTVNAELHEKNIELIELNSDIENLMKNVNIGTIFLDQNFKIRKYTPSINEHFQLIAEDIGRPISHFSGILGGEDIVKLSKKVIESLHPYKTEVTNDNGNHFLMQIFPYKDEENIAKGVVINFIDIDNLKAETFEKEKLNAFLSHITYSNPAIIYIYDIISKKNIYASSDIMIRAGYTKREVKRMGENFLLQIVHPDDLLNVSNHIDKLKSLSDEEVLQLEYRIIHKTTKEHIWLLSTDKINERNCDGSVKTILGVAQIITQTKNLQKQLKESEERYRLAIIGTGSCLWEWSDLLNDKAWWSPELYDVLGYTSKEMKSKFSGLIKLIHPDQIESFRNGLETHVENKKFFEEEIQLRTKKEGYKWFRINCQVKFDKNHLAKKVVGTILDIDRRKESERKMKELNIELERFAYLASHDLKEPLRTVTSFTKLFKDEYIHLFDDSAMQYLNFIEKASSRMITLTNDLLVYSQLDDKSLNFEPIEINRLISTIKDDLQDFINKCNAEIIVSALPTVTCDALQIRQLFQNLLTNSLKYNNNKKPKVEIGYNEKPTFFEFYIKDNGIGIAKKDYHKIFEVFKRLHSQTEYEGTGIGLANCKRIVDNHKGKIWVKSTLGKGSKFFFTIPKI